MGGSGAGRFVRQAGVVAVGLALPVVTSPSTTSPPTTAPPGSTTTTAPPGSTTTTAPPASCDYPESYKQYLTPEQLRATTAAGITFCGPG